MKKHVLIDMNGRPKTQSRDSWNQITDSSSPHGQVLDQQPSQLQVYYAHVSVCQLVSLLVFQCQTTCQFVCLFQTVNAISGNSTDSNYANVLRSLSSQSVSLMICLFETSTVNWVFRQNDVSLQLSQFITSVCDSVVVLTSVCDSVCNSAVVKTFLFLRLTQHPIDFLPYYSTMGAKTT